MGNGVKIDLPCGCDEIKLQSGETEVVDDACLTSSLTFHTKSQVTILCTCTIKDRQEQQQSFLLFFVSSKKTIKFSYFYILFCF
jgi:hypothetical protein